MLKFFVRWRMNPKETFKTPKERDKLVMLMLDSVKSDMQVGLITDWGTCVDGSGGYLIYEVQSEKEMFDSLRKWMPQVAFDARQVLTIEQLIASRKGAPSQIGTKTP
jgi:hypothetical protein